MGFEPPTTYKMAMIETSCFITSINQKHNNKNFAIYLEDNEKPLDYLCQNNLGINDHKWIYFLLS
jgi:hypothetical protein